MFKPLNRNCQWSRKQNERYRPGRWGSSPQGHRDFNHTID